MPTNAINDEGVKYVYDKLDAKKVDKETGKGLSTNDYSNADKSKVDKIDETTSSKSGNPISISGLKANQLAKDPIITFEPIQAGSGTPSPSNIRAISGYDKIEVLSCGKNLFDVDKVIRNSAISVSGNNISITPVGYNTDLFSGNTGESGASAKKLYLKAGTYAISFSFVGTAPQLNSIYVNTIDETTLIPNGNIGRKTSGQTFVITKSSWICLKLVSNSTCTLKDIQIEESSSATTYEPYNKTTSISESLGQTVYWLTHTVRTGIAKILGQLLINPQNLDWHEGARNVFYAALPSGVGNGLSSHYAFSNLPYQTMDDLTWYTNNNYIYVRNTNYSGNIPGFAASLNDVQFVYLLATPTEIQLTPHEISLLKDYAYLSTNGTNISLDYHNGELASLADVSQLGETVNELSQAFRDGCDEIMGAVAAKGVTPASNSPDDISKAIRSLVTYEQPIEFDYRCGYITNGVWYYEKPTNTLSDIYEVKNGHTYYMFFGNVTGTRFRAITTTTDIRTVTSGTITGDQTVKNSVNPGPLSYVTFTSTVDGYFIVCKDNVGKTGITTYMQDRTTM